MKPDQEAEVANLRSIVKYQASQLETLAAQLEMAMRSNKELLEANAQLSLALMMGGGKK